MMRRLGNWSMICATLAFTALPILAAGCAEQATSTPAASGEGAAASTDDGLDDLDEELGEPMEAGSGLGLPEAGSGLGLPESGSALE